jgi:Xaa-Pro dipeptidase
MRARVKKIFRNIDDHLDLVVLLNSIDPHVDVSFFYATGLTDGLFEGCAAWLHPDGSAEIMTSALEEEAAKKSGLPLHVFRNREEPPKLLRKLLAGHRRIGINAAELTHDAFERLQKSAPKSARFVDVSAAITRSRLVKDDSEVALIQKACDIASKSFHETLPVIRPGVQEAEIAAELVYHMQRNGATGPSFRTIVGSGPNGAEPHYTAGPRRVRKGDLIVIDFGSLYHMYCSDITRTVVVGKPTDEQRSMYDTVARAQKAALAKMKPGVKGKAVDAAARSLIDSTKYKGRFIHGLGHSVGLAVHDGGGLYTTSELVLKSNMVLTDEPGVYIPGFGGVRIEDDVLVTPTGARYMSTARRELIEV